MGTCGIAVSVFFQKSNLVKIPQMPSMILKKSPSLLKNALKGGPKKML